MIALKTNYVVTENGDIKYKPRPGGEKRGNSYARRMRKAWLLAHFGTGDTCQCVHCRITLVFATIEADRIIPGKSYRRNNIQPSCRTCNASRSNDPKWKGPLA